MMYMVFVAILGSLLLALLCYFLSLFGSSGGGDSSNAGKTSELYYDTRFVAKTLDQLQVALRLMPSQVNEGNMILMEWTEFDSKEEGKLSSNVGADDYFFFFNDTKDLFPTLRYEEEYVPMGDAKTYCVHLDWIRRDQKRMLDMYHSVTNFPECENSLNPKFRWQEGDPKDGIDVQVWRQHSEEVSSSSGCHGGIYVAFRKREGGKCYTYDVLQRMCLMIRFIEHPETASYAWEYMGGCYQGGEVAIYEPAEIGKTYDFTYVPIEVREDESFMGGFSSGGGSGGSTTSGGESGGSFFGSLSSLFFIAALLAGVAFGGLYYLAWKGLSAGDAFNPRKLPD